MDTDNNLIKLLQILELFCYVKRCFRQPQEGYKGVKKQHRFAH